MLYPLQRALLVPVEALGGGARLPRRAGAARSPPRRRRAASWRASRSAPSAPTSSQLENARLRALLELRPTLDVRSQAAEVLYEAADPYSRKVIIDRGVTHNVVLGSPVINEAGVLGQVTRVYLQSSEVTLLTDRDAAIPVLNSRTQARSAAFGGAHRRRRPARDALHGRQRRRPGRRRAHDLGRRRRLSARAARSPRWPRSTARSTPASPASSSRRRRRPTACATSSSSSRPACACRRGRRRRRRKAPAASKAGGKKGGAQMIMPRAQRPAAAAGQPALRLDDARGRLPAQHRAARPGAGDARLPGARARLLERAPVAPGRRRRRLLLRPADGRAQRRRARPACARLHAAQLLRGDDPPPPALVHGAVAGGADPAALSRRAGGLAGRPPDRRRHVPGLGADPRAGVSRHFCGLSPPGCCSRRSAAPPDPDENRPL